MRLIAILSLKTICFITKKPEHLSGSLADNKGLFLDLLPCRHFAFKGFDVTFVLQGQGNAVKTFK